MPDDDYPMDEEWRARHSNPNDPRPYPEQWREALKIEAQNKPPDIPEIDPNDPRPFHVRAGEAIRNHFGQPLSHAPKLTLEGRCQVYAALYTGVPQSVVRKAYNLSRATVSHIGGCRDDDQQPIIIEFGPYSETIGGSNINRRSPGRRARYSEVAREFETLGEDEFLRRYLTPYVQHKIMRAKAEIKTRVWLD